jgi:multidrug resistance efflux pump
MGIEIGRADSFDRAAPGGPDRVVAGLEALLALEAEARACGTIRELAHLAANDTRRVIRCQQITTFALAGQKARVLAVTGLSSVERASPMLLDLERVLGPLARGAAGPTPVGLDALRAGDPTRLQDLAIPHFVIVPLCHRKGAPFAGLLLGREEAWGERDMPLLARLGETYAHAWAGLAGRPRRLGRASRTSTLAGVVAVLAVGAGFVPVPLTALAPVEVVPRDPAVVTAPLDGVIRSIEVDPNQPVAAGTVLVRFVDTALRSRLEVAERGVDVARAKETRLAQAAFSDPAARRDQAVAAAELAVAVAERDASAQLLERSVVTADRPGLAVYGSRKDWEGRPVATGERIMQVASPGAVQLRIEMPVKDAIVVRDGAAVRIYLDSDPLKPLAGRLEQASYHAAPVAGGALAFALLAGLEPGEAPPRIGYRGTAQVFGDRVPLAYYVLRRPLTAARQWVGL